MIQTLNTLPDEQTEYLISNRLSFMRFLGLSLSDRVTDVKTIWLFRERLTPISTIGRLFERFNAHTVKRRLSANVRPDPERNTGGGSKAA